MRGAAGAAFLCTTNRGKLLQHKLIHVQCTKKSTRVPVSPVLGDSKFRFLFAPFHRGDFKFGLRIRARGCEAVLEYTYGRTMVCIVHLQL